MDDDYFRILVIAVAAILAVSLLINVILASDINAFTTPPVRVHGYFTQEGKPAPGYYVAPEKIPEGVRTYHGLMVYELPATDVGARGVIGPGVPGPAPVQP